VGMGARFRGVESGSCRLKSVGGKRTGSERERGASGKGRERPRQVGSAVREGWSMGGSTVPGRSGLERGSGVRTEGGGRFDNPSQG
jgi:hypothetical protein